MKEKSMNMGQGPVFGVLLKLGLLAMVSMFFQNLYNLVDTVFVSWLAFVFPAMGFTMICEGVFLSYGDAKTPMKVMIAGNLINIILDPSHSRWRSD